MLPHRSLLGAAALSLASITLLHAAELPGEQDRLLATAKLWGAVKYFHPYLAYRDVDWDKALVDALPRIRTAANRDQYAAALSGMLEVLHDNRSRIVEPGTKDSPTGSTPYRTWVRSGASSAFLIASSPAEAVMVPMGADVIAKLELSEPVLPSLPVVPKPQAERAYADTPYPSVEYRILSAYKLWGAVRNFFAYRDLMDEDWDQALGEFLPKFIAATNKREYNLAVAEALTMLDDSNASIRSTDLDEYFGTAPVGLRIRLVEKKPLVTEVLDDEAKKASVEVGDVITKVDGEDIVARIHREIAFIPGSTDQSLAAQVSERVLSGPDGSDAALTIQGKDGQTKNVSLKRSTGYRDKLAIQRSGDVVSFLSKAIGYVDLDRLQAEQIDSVFEKLQGTTGIILDMRGRLHLDPALLAARFVQKPDTAAAIITGPINLRPDLPSPRLATQTASFFRVETLPAPLKAPYKGKTVMLVDERTAGPAEHLGLLLEAANKTTFVGTLSAGADSETGSFVLPGGITISFSTTDIRHGNGGKLQRVGLEPAATAAPTIGSIRSGRDPVIEKALDFIVSE